ncbi:MAG: endolytic transglycosylase MltG [Xanthomonadales bacterium]|nr:endolytic transglycosylase MltG [Xanthomonadales bacterium]
MNSTVKKTTKWLGRSALLVVLVLISGYVVLSTRYQAFKQQPLAIAAEGQVFVVDPGMSGRAVINRLQDAGITEWNWQWRWLMRQQPDPLKAGEYRLAAGFTAPQLLHILQAGEVIHYRFTIVEGWTVSQLLLALQADELLGNGAEDMRGLTAIVQQLTKVENPEGWFLPETYQFVRGYSASDLLQRAYQDMQVELQRAWEMRVTEHPLQTPYELLVLASIIERETAVDSEREDISGVFVRRLQKGMRLQTDPTVIYGLGSAYAGDIRKKDLQTDTPYNTYTRFGLPPTPIALPGVAALQAAANPKAGSSLYFVADGQGGHTFSNTFEDHQKAVNIMLGRKP